MPAIFRRCLEPSSLCRRERFVNLSHRLHVTQTIVSITQGLLDEFLQVGKDRGIHLVWHYSDK
jgi:hypothetical protein